MNNNINNRRPSPARFQCGAKSPEFLLRLSGRSEPRLRISADLVQALLALCQQNGLARILQAHVGAGEARRGPVDSTNALNCNLTGLARKKAPSTLKTVFYMQDW